MNDKAKHYLVSFFLTALLGCLMDTWGAALLCLMIGIAKELIWDLWLKNGTPEWGDLLADMLGILTFCVCYLIGTCVAVLI